MITSIDHRLVEVTFDSVPTAHELREVKRTIASLSRSQLQGLAVLCTITEGGLGTLAPDARQAVLSEWKSMRGVIACAAIVIVGDSVVASLTRGFVRMLGTALGRAWTVHTDRASALRRLATALGLPETTWIRRSA
ncbi:MAG: hypothetical protein ACLQVI_08870 [Polyangiaceae bacterium]